MSIWLICVYGVSMSNPAGYQRIAQLGPRESRTIVVQAEAAETEPEARLIRLEACRDRFGVMPDLAWIEG